MSSLAIMNKLTQCIAKLLESPVWKTVFSVTLPVIAGVLSGIFIAEISSAQGIQWKTFYKAWSFYGLLGLIIVVYLYNRALYLREREIMQFSDSEFCIAYMRSKCLPEAAERHKEMIRSGEVGELLKIMTELKESLK